MVHGRGRRARPDELPGADPLRRVHRSRAVRARIRDRLAGSRAVRHAGRHDPRADAGRAAEPLHRGIGRRRRARAPRARRSARRPPRHRARRPADSPRADRQERGADAAPQRLSGIGVRAEHRSAVPAGQHHHGAGRIDLHRGHVSRHHPGIELDAAGLVPAAQDRSVSARQGHRPRAHLAPALRRPSRRAGDAGGSRGAGDAGDSRAARARARSHASAHARRDAGAARRASEPPERLVARYGAAAPRAAAGQVRGARAPEPRPHARTTWSRAFTRCGRSKGSARSTSRSCASR